MTIVRVNYFRSLSDEEFLKVVDNFIDKLSKENDRVKKVFMYQFIFFGQELKRRGL